MKILLVAFLTILLSSSVTWAGYELKSKIVDASVSGADIQGGVQGLVSKYPAAFFSISPLIINYSDSMELHAYEYVWVGTSSCSPNDPRLDVTLYDVWYDATFKDGTVYHGHEPMVFSGAPRSDDPCK